MEKLYENWDNGGNFISCHRQPNGNKIHILHMKDTKIEHTIVEGRIRMFINGKKEFGGKEYAEFYFFPVRDSRATVLVDVGNKLHEIPHHVFMGEGLFLGDMKETLDRKIYLPMETVRKF